MTEKLSRRDFLKLAGLGLAGTTVLTGCGPASRYVTREPYTKMPEYNYNGQSTYFATTCRECAAGCGLVVRTMQGRAIKTEGNKYNPVNLGKTCARGQATLQGLYNPDRVQNPVRNSRGESDPTGVKAWTDMDWEAAIGIVEQSLQAPAEVQFLLGLAPDHLFDLVADLCKSIGAPAPIRYGALGTFEARATLGEASRAVFGRPDLLFFDLANAETTISFGANFLETWVSPVAYTRGFSRMRQGAPGKRGHLVQLEPRLSQTAAKADEWHAILPGTEGLVAAALGKLYAEKKIGTVPAAFEVDVQAAGEASGLGLEHLEHLADLLVKAEHPLVIPGGAALAHENGLETAKAILALNALLDNLGKPGGVFHTAASPLGEEYRRPASAKEMSELVTRMNEGKIKTLFVHGVNPLFELPKALGFEAALIKVSTVISFATFLDETAMAADFIFPDHHGLESWGYQRVATGTGQSTLSGAQPVIAPFYNTKSTIDVLLAAAKRLSSNVETLPFNDEVEFIQSKVAGVVETEGGFYRAADLPSFWALFQQFGGWWKNESGLGAPEKGTQIWDKLNLTQAKTEGEFHLLVYPSPVMAEAGANKPWLQEIPDPMTTVMWNSWVEINPHTAEFLGLQNDDLVRIISPFGAVEVSVYKYPAIRPDVVAIPFGQGHTAYGRYAENRGVNPADLFGTKTNGAGDLAFAGTKVRIEKTGKKRELSRLESKLGVYAEGLEEH
jgi:anaerobic selenocysteine-containing dehydrogenase